VSESANDYISPQVVASFLRFGQPSIRRTPFFEERFVDGLSTTSFVANAVQARGRSLAVFCHLQWSPRRRYGNERISA